MVYTLTLNPALDYDVYVEDFREEELNGTKEVKIRAGGKGINVSKVLKNLEVETCALGFTGGFTGIYIQEELKKEQIPFDFVPAAGITRINIKINNGGKETEIAGQSPELSKEDQEKLLQKLDQIQKDDILVMSGSIPETLPQDIYKQLAAYVRGKQGSGLKVVLDTRGALLQENMMPYFFIKPNIVELEEMFRKKLETDRDIVDACRFFLDQGVENVIVSKGGQGAVLVTRDRCFSAKAPQGELINSVGAGDSMVAGFITGQIWGKNPLEAFALAVACGSATAFSYGLAQKAGVLELWEKVQPVQL